VDAVALPGVDAVPLPASGVALAVLGALAAAVVTANEPLAVDADALPGVDAVPLPVIGLAPAELGAVAPALGGDTVVCAAVAAGVI
jgi:hypothetical protein